MATKSNKASGEVLDSKLRQPIEKMLTTKEVIALTGKTAATIRRYARMGVLVRVKAKGMKQGVGYTGASVRALVEGRAE